ncbi:MAG: DNA replication protein DnaC [Candidatus Azotimanducaceae bacterium]|jgi:DNA replication protein DnaC
MQKGNPTILDKLQAGLLDEKTFRQEVLNEVYVGLHQYCQIPEGYQNCDLATQLIDLPKLSDTELKSLLKDPPSEIVNPYPSQIKAITLFEMLLSGDPLACEEADPLKPTLGAYLYGPPGSGKTHLLAAYARRLKILLDSRISDVHDMMTKVIEDACAQFFKRIGSEREVSLEEMGHYSLENDELVLESSPEEEFWHTIDLLKSRVAGYDYQPTDLIYIGFKELFEVCKHSAQRDDAMHALESARVVFIDDIHPQGDPEQIQLVLHLLERRYEMGQTGTFLTTNLQTEALGGGDEMLGNRLMSRCAETLVTIDFSDCDDWRKKVKSHKIRMIEDALEIRSLEHKHRAN